ncbi:MAG TPA: 6-bladed beta-propeller [Longimicrobiaceae bacterium]|nr:6-bladed beta-propeller [Longimicrobiaceae bacterium]
MWTVTEELRIGSVDDPAQALTAVGPLAIGPQGDLHVGQPQDGIIRVFDPRGNAVRAIGRPGKGPGEFQRLWQLGLLHDTLYAVDFALRRVSFFSTEGDHLATRAFPVSEPGGHLVPMPPFLFLPDGTAVMTPAVPDGAGSDDVPQTPFLHVTREGEVLDTLAWQSRENASLTIARGASRISATQPFRDWSFVETARDRLRMAVIDRKAAETVDKAEFRVTMLAGRGDTVYARAYPYRPVPLPGAVAEQAIERKGRLHAFALSQSNGG